MKKNRKAAAANQDAVFSDAPFTSADSRGDSYSYNPTKGYIRPEPEKSVLSPGGLTAACILCVLLAVLLGGVMTLVFVRRHGSPAEDAAARPSELSSLYSGLELLGQTENAGEAMLLELISETEQPVLSAEDIYVAARQTTVGISIPGHTQNIFGQSGRFSVSGSGIILREDGYILTNYHVIEPSYEDGSPIFVITCDGEEYPAELVGAESGNDLAVLKIDRTDLTPAVLGNSDELRVGQSIYVVGNPLGELTFSMTGGILSALEREITTDENITVNMFQIDAAVNSGNSGGPVYNDRGQVIGVVTAKYSRDGMEGLGFAIPIADAASIAEELMTNGYVSGKAYIGLTMTTVSESVAAYYGMTQGVYVNDVEPGSCAMRAGLRVGDIITAVDDLPVTSNSALVTAMKNYRAGDSAVLTVYRNGQTLPLSVVFDEELPATALTDEEIVMRTSDEMGLPHFGKPSAELREVSGEPSN